ncbi:unnamed protein product [Candidatus Protochlamydia amoebophila UWE25]|uniref:Uncharacterized protein n=1 Tax=Protochlamydia amoebophila (strain UWE25) TaxID=264201 RepID=Q6MDV2_PARUW|nr:unnamed protein product [Candidatus Protochlamydia amoebophila UWE25]
MPHFLNAREVSWEKKLDKFIDQANSSPSLWTIPERQVDKRPQKSTTNYSLVVTDNPNNQEGGDINTIKKNK